MRDDKYTLNEQGEPVPCPDVMDWGRWFGSDPHLSKRIVKQEWVDNVHVSTVFLGLNHSFGNGPPVLWETMCFSNQKEWDTEMDRCSGGREQAEAMHQRMVARVKAELKEKK